MVDLGCGARCAKLIILTINFFFVLIGFVLLGFGIFLVIDTKALHREYFAPLGGSAEQIIIAAGVILIVGICILFLTAIGCCAAAKEHAGCLTFYSVILILLLILQIAAVITAGVFYNTIINGLDDKMSEMVKLQYGQPKYNDSTEFIDNLQSKLHCCGVTEGPLDWKNSAYHNNSGPTVPESCCTMDGNYIVNKTQCLEKAYEPNASDRSKYIYIEGCDAKLDRLIKHYVGVLIGVVIGVVVIQIIFIIITCLLKSSVARGYEYI